MTRPVGALSTITLACLLAALPGCGGGGSPNTPTTLPPAPVTTVITQGTFHLGNPATALGSGQICDLLDFVPFTTSVTGTLGATVNWSHATNDVDVFIERGTCTCNAAVAGQCDDVASSQSTTAKPEILTVSGFAAGTYTLVVANSGPGSEAGSYQVVLTH
jgi:hypothetical protein